MEQTALAAVPHFILEFHNLHCYTNSNKFERKNTCESSDASIKKETANESKRDRQTYGRTFMAFASIISLLIMIGIAISFLGSNSEKKEAEELKKIGIISNNFESLYSFYESRTSLQQSEYWESIKGKQVQWSGTVSEVRSAYILATHKM
ncbi:hypothetical protein [Paenibacillus sp. UNC451MF]|uniref:hypothetical protein n=1 Tax=Paenibacillus sp. UNC451MF TaxID=1449063 RepID=UPI00048B1CE3|nr:hypothetical protein [Paenibacillus sp. UNC451MF]